MKFPSKRIGLGITTIPNAIKRSYEYYRELTALKIREGDTWRHYTYGEMYLYIKRLARYFRDTDLEVGDRIAVIGENSPEWCISYLGVLWGGYTVVPLDPKLTVSEWKHILMDAEVKLVVSSVRFVSDFIELRDDVDSLKTVISMDPFPGVLNLYSIFSMTDELGEPCDISEDNTAVILYTSGTTGSSKGVMLTHRNIISNVDSIYQCIIYGPEDTFFSILPLHHVFEATAGFLAPLYGGAKIVFARSLKPNEIREDMSATNPTVSLIVPLFLEKLLQGIMREVKRLPSIKRCIFNGLRWISMVVDVFLKGRAKRLLFRSLRAKTGFGTVRYVICGGAALPSWVSEGLEKLGFPILQGYGLSEASPVVTVNPPDRPKNYSVGLPIPGVEVTIVSPDENGIGEVAVRGDNVMKGYYKNEKGTAEVKKGGWLYTGDLGFIDEDGYLYITGRKKSVIITPGGKNVYPEEVEEELLKSPYIEEILVLRGQNPKTQAEEVQCIVFPNYEKIDELFREEGKSTPTEEDVLDIIKREITEYSKNLADYKRPRRITIREEEFPKTTTRKIKRYLFEKPSVEV